MFTFATSVHPFQWTDSSNKEFGRKGLVTVVVMDPWTILTFNGQGWGLYTLVFETPVLGR